MAIGKADQLPDIDAQLGAEQRQLVGKGDVDVPEAVLDQLAHLRRARIGLEHVTRDEASIEVAGDLRRFGVSPPTIRAFSVSSTMMRPGSTRSGQ